jgi:hypothetical protein
MDPDGRGVTVATIVKRLAEYPNEYDTLQAAIWEAVPSKDGRFPTSRSIGQKLHHLRKRVIGGRFLDSKDSNQGAVWAVRGAGRSDSKGSSDSNPAHNAHARTRAHARMGQRPEILSLLPLLSLLAPVVAALSIPLRLRFATA